MLSIFPAQPLARGLAVGLLCGLIPGPLQIAATIVLCSLLRANVVLGVATTFYTNPLTIVPLYALAFQIGSALLPGEQTMPVFDHAAAADGCHCCRSNTEPVLARPTTPSCGVVVGFFQATTPPTLRNSVP